MSTSQRRRKQQQRLRKALQRAHASLGHLRGEDDSNLATYYVDPKGIIERALDREDPTMVFKGSKGSGKSAILKMIELRRAQDLSRIVRVHPDDLAFTALANVRADTPLLGTAARNQWLFKCLWQYVLSVNLLSREYPVSGGLFHKLSSLFRGDEVRRAQKLLSLTLTDSGKPAPSFTATMISLIREIELSVQGQGGISGSAIVRLDQTALGTSSTLPILHLVDQVARSLPSLLAADYYLLVDDLDLHWTNDPLQNALIAALFSAMNKMGAARKVKFLVAIRDDIYKELPIENKDKSRDWICELGWDRQALREMIERRMFVLHQIPAATLWGDLMPNRGFDQMMEHSLGRPRELLRHMQMAINVACDAGHEVVEPADLIESMRKVSEERLEELEQEVDHKFPGIRWIARHFTGRKREFDIRTLKDVAETIALELADRPENVPYRWAESLHETPRKFGEILCSVGFLLVKTSRSAPPQEIREPQILDGIEDPWFAIKSVYCPALSVVGT